MDFTSFESLYKTRTHASHSIFERAIRYLPGGVAGNGKYLALNPICVKKAQGGEFIDLGGNRSIDLLAIGRMYILYLPRIQNLLCRIKKSKYLSLELE